MSIDASGRLHACCRHRVYVLYLIAGNLCLNASLDPSALNRKPEKFQMQWATQNSFHLLWAKQWYDPSRNCRRKAVPARRS